MLDEIGFVDVSIGEPVDTFGGSEGEDKARAYEVFGYSFLARNPESPRRSSWGGPGLQSALSPVRQATCSDC
ncbi:MAG: hypothetical protein M3046_10045 [Actinomycetota bacterium]|jgi:hypothetical protein|nr:hypothetical protein [Actinomycetota bacterium]